MSDARSIGSRVAAIVLVAVIFFSVVAVSGAVVWQVHQQNKQASATDSKQESSQTSESSQASNQTKGGAKLEGTKLSNFTVIDHIDTLSSTDPVVGTGQEVKASDTVTAHYTGALAKTGIIFQSSLDSGKPFTSALSGLIKGWQQGIPGMKVGGTRRLLIPSSLAYGAQAQAGIPANSDLVFDIQLISIGG